MEYKEITGREVNDLAKVASARERNQKRKPLKKKESNLKYILLAVAVVLVICYIAYEKSDINLKDIELFGKKDKVENVENTGNVIQLDSNLTGMADIFTDDMISLITTFVFITAGVAVIGMVVSQFFGRSGLV